MTHIHDLREAPSMPRSIEHGKCSSSTGDMFDHRGDIGEAEIRKDGSSKLVASTVTW
jgi:hypothetical protein